ncbi:hypothetical protein A7A08_02135 [Methyloligella halotolerans]|uniref:Phage protein, HK97 gp10 family n=1 Tax=Methyloligella halotolerans TaxID=1177755 RepID=A0A1E2RXL2_9HYPH|nr:HK97-gp10 family putative phage morphogenesis protein [Methyloligella halotolerans]ODA66838.1 hypothetical protein A7A08_02135 [Methyloligella halotolerans]
MRSIGRLSGLEALKRRLDIGAAPQDLREELRDQASVIADEARQALEQEHPGGTGALARSIRVVETAEQDAPRFTIGTASPVGRYLEFGTRRMGAQPWLTPALRRHLPDVRGCAERIIARFLKSDSSEVR